MKTVPNQRVVIIHREYPSSDFLGIKNENWQAAARDLGAHALLLYLYFAANRDNFRIALSPAAIRQAIGMPPQTYRDQMNKLIDKHYLVLKSGNTYDFYETPQHGKSFQDNKTYDVEAETGGVFRGTFPVETQTVQITEINRNNKYKKNLSEKQASPKSEEKDKFVF